MNWTHIHWASWSDFWAMGGYGFYVWGSLLVTFGLMLAEIWQARAAHENALREVALMAELDAESRSVDHSGDGS